jgi:hypothetical protein
MHREAAKPSAAAVLKAGDRELVRAPPRPGSGVSPIGAGLAGNLAVGRILGAHGIRAKLKVSQRGDPEEDEADRLADAMISGSPVHTIQRKCAGCSSGHPCSECEEEELHPKLAAGEARVHISRAHEAVAAVASGGQPVPRELRAAFEPRLNRPLSEVRLHTEGNAGAAAQQIGARAYTVGSHIAFAPGEFRPADRSGQQLIAHELAHVVQQGAAGAAPAIQRQPEPYTGPPPGAEKSDDEAPLVKPHDKNPKVQKPPDPKGELVEHVDTHVTFTDNVEYVRYQLQTFVAAKGSDRVDAFLSGSYVFGSGLGPLIGPPPPAATPQRKAYLDRVITLVRSEVKMLQLRMDEFYKDFERRAVDKLNEMLDASKARVEKEREHYNVNKEDSDHSVETGKETEDLTRRSRDLLSKQAVVLSAKEELERAQPYGPHGELPPGGAPKPEEVEAENAARKKYDAAQREYSLARAAAERRHPVMMGYNLDPLLPNTAETLSNLGSTSSTVQANTLAAEIDTKLENIETVRNKVLDDHSKVWSLSAVVDATKTYPDIQNYRGLNSAVTSTLLAEKAGTLEAEAELVGIFSGIALLIIGLVAAVPTGGLSVGAAAAVSGAGVLEAGLMAFTAYQATEKYRFELAASGTDFDKAKAISEEEPSLFWLALEIIGAVVALPKGLSAFRRLVGLRRMAIAAKAAGDLSEAESLLTKIEKEGDELGRGVGSKLKSETEELSKARTQHAPEFDELQQNLGKRRPSSMPGYTEEVPLEGDHFWRKSSDGTWCRFSPGPLYCFRTGTIEGEALEEQLLEAEAEQTSRRTIRANLEKSGIPLPPGGKWQAHHIVPWQLRDHPVVVFVREKFGWSMNSAENAVALPTTTADAGKVAGKVATHSGSHAIYTMEVANDLDNLQTAWNNYSPVKIYSKFQAILDRNRARMISELAGVPLR